MTTIASAARDQPPWGHPRRDAAVQPQQALADSPTRDAVFETIFRGLPDIVLVIDGASGRILEANQAVRRILGREPQGLVGRDFAAALELEGTGSAVGLLDLVRLHAAAVVDWEVRRIDGSLCPMHVRAAAARWGEGEAVLITLRDVTERRKAEAALRAAEHKYRSIYENTIEGIFQTTPDGRYLSANPALARIYGYPTQEALVADLTDIAGRLYVEPGRRDQFRLLLEEHDVVEGFESQVRRADGSVVWISENARAVRDAAGGLLYYEGTVVDTTARRRAEEARRCEAAVAGALARAGQEVIAVLDAPRLLARLCQVLREVLDADATQALLWDAKGNAHLQVCAAGEGVHVGADAARPCEPVPADVWARLQEGQVVALDADGCAALPRPLHPECSAALFFCVPRGAMATAVVLGAYRRSGAAFQTEHERIARGVVHLAALGLEHADAIEALARANRLKSEFVATMSHELRTPLHIILGYDDLLLGEAFGPLTFDQSDALQHIARSGRDLLALIDATLDLSRLDNGRLPLAMRPLDVPALLRDVAAEVAHLTDKPGVRVRWEIDAGLRSLVADSAKLKVILENLIDNAMKFTDSGEVRIGVRRHAEGVELSVADTGSGIAPDALPIIFEAFRQADGSMTRRHGGIGLGLHLVQRLLDLMGGTISVESAPGAGSTFRVWLPGEPG